MPVPSMRAATEDEAKRGALGGPRMLRQTSKRAPHSSPVLRCRSLTSAFRRGVYACVDMCVEHALKIWRVQSSELILANGLSQHLSPHTVHPACARRKWPCLASGLSASPCRGKSSQEKRAADAVRGAWGGWVGGGCVCLGGGRWWWQESKDGGRGPLRRCRRCHRCHLSPRRPRRRTQ